MNRPPRGLPFAALALALCCAVTMLAPVAGAAEPTISYQHESEQDFAKQLAGGQVRAVIINKRIRTLRVTLSDGRHVLARYPKHEEPQVAARLKAKGVAVTLLAKAQAEQDEKAKKPVHHKIRYIVGAVVIAVIVIVGAVLIVNRRRQRD